VPRNIRLAEAPSHGKAALVYDPRSKGAESYIRLAKEIIERQPSAVSSQPSGQTLTTGDPGRGGEQAGEEIAAADEMDKTA
jgi:nitrogenase subunit NifH